jgi:hypothetical protein
MFGFGILSGIGQKISSFTGQKAPVTLLSTSQLAAEAKAATEAAKNHPSNANPRDFAYNKLPLASSAFGGVKSQAMESRAYTVPRSLSGILQIIRDIEIHLAQSCTSLTTREKKKCAKFLEYCNLRIRLLQKAMVKKNDADEIRIMAFSLLRFMFKARPFIPLVFRDEWNILIEWEASTFA